MLNPSLPPQRKHHLHFSAGKSLPEILVWGFSQKDPSLKKDIPEWVSHVFFHILEELRSLHLRQPTKLTVLHVYLKDPKGGGMGMIGQFVSASSQKKKHTERSFIFIEYVWEEYLLSIWDAPSPSNVGNRDFHPLWLSHSRWSVFFCDVKILCATQGERILCVVKEREGLTEVNDTVFLVRSLSFGCYVDLKHDIQKGCSPGKCRTDTCTKSTEWYIWSVQVDVFSLQDRRCTTICSQVTWRSLICHQPKSHFPWIKCFLIGFYWHFPGWHPTFVQRGKAFDSLELSGAPRLRCLRLSGCKGLQTRQLHHGGKLGGFRAWWWMGLKNRSLKVRWFLLCFSQKSCWGLMKG